MRSDNHGRGLRYLASALLLFTGLGCSTPDAPDQPGVEGPVTVEIKVEEGRHRLYRDGEPYYIRGAGLERRPPGAGNITLLAEHGANSFRTWGTDRYGQRAQVVLDEAHANGLTVTLGLELVPERHGFDYSDSTAVAEQFEKMKEQVLTYKDHPALIIWAIGNELNLNAANPLVWNAVNDLSEMIHEVDPHHLTTTTLAGIGPELADQLRERAPDLDIISIQMYGDIVNLPRYLEEISLDRPYLVTEWGATGHWEVPTTPWGAPIENTSSVKADAYLERYRRAIESDTLRCLGYYVFLWGQKQERTPTWYGVFLPSGEETESVDVMHHVWTGNWPENRTPRVNEFLLDGRTAYDGIYLDRGRAYPAAAEITDPDGDTVTYRWTIMHESTDLGMGGDFETTPDELTGLITPADSSSITVTAPDEPGAYRLFVNAFDGQGHAAHANIPFFVNE